MTQVSNASYIAKQRVVYATPYKLNLVASLIRNQKVDLAINQLKLSRKHAALEMLNVLQAAVANAEHNFNADFDTLYIDSVLIGKSHVLKRFFPRARGRAGKILKIRSNLTIKLKAKLRGRDGSKG
ncbi:50S ribosomal subunit protein L22 [Candidatus Xenohaliotis californiensis]|uniref:Large ribosomal subunit protein uL22 n=1 Tax=Candidatus Xenohaliotis californiensis TaxID=84677 RepID=A0ABP0ET85_9RICK|nr:50S ribosomal subunit protein L22 [Candidatus Xenohaliotis californiensis]